MNFWSTLPKPFFALAPMADVTDAAFRRLFAKYGKPDVTWTEFVSCDGLWHTREKQGLTDAENPLIQDLLYTEAERPIVAQLFSSKPEMMEYGAALVRELGFDGVDINMGCPDRSIEKQGCGAAMIKNPSLAREIIDAAKRGARMGEVDGIPVSVKTRIGYNRDDTDTWLPVLLECGIAALTVHARTRKEMSLVPARWEQVRRAVELRNEICATKKTKATPDTPWRTSDVLHGVEGEAVLGAHVGVEKGEGANAYRTLIIGNGDVGSLAEGRARVEETGCDGVMIGRGIFGNPWFFDSACNRDTDISIPERLEVLVEHTNLFSELLPHKNFAIMKKHFKAYVNGWDGAKELRNALMESQNAEEVEQVIHKCLQELK